MKYIKKANTDISSNYFIVGPCRHSASIENGYISVLKPPISNPTFVEPSANGRYAVGIILQATCCHGFKLEGPILEECTTSGNWQQINHEQDDCFYSSDYLRKCLPSNIDNIFLKLIIIREEFSYIFHYLIHEIHIIYLKNHVLVYCDSYPQPGNSERLSIKNGVWGTNERSVDSVATVTCGGNFYPSNKGNMPGHTPTTRTKSSTCRQSKDGKTAYLDDGINRCVPGNENQMQF